ncbi:MAG: hypothetical protein RL291_489 [Pseudomonadota bacterium]
MLVPIRRLRTCLVAMLAILLSSAAASAAPPAKQRPLTEAEHKAAEKAFTRPEAVLAFIQSYRAKPQPRAVPAIMRALVRHGVFRDGDGSGVYVGFIAGTIGNAGDGAGALIESFFPMPPEDQVGLVKAIAYSGHPDWKGLLIRQAERMPARRDLIHRFVSGSLPALEALKLDQGSSPIDVLWGRYYATGSYEPILRIVSVLDWSADGNNVERLTIGSMAKFTLAQNAARDTDLLRLLKQARDHEVPKTKKILVEIIEAAELAEVGKIRQSALTAIDTLKAKGPADARKHQWWGQVGQTALALGCVVAGVMGQVQVGIPCVIGGAVSSAALKLTEPR